MIAPPSPADDPADPHPGQGTLFWYRRGAANLFTLPSLILAGAFVGFAGLARETGVGMAEAMFMTLMIWALPAKAILVAATATGTGLIGTALAVALSSVRMMPMVAALVPELRDGARTRTSVLLFLSHFVAITAWVLAMQRIGEVPRRYRTAYFAGTGTALTGTNTVLVGLVYLFAAQVPPAILGALFFLTPIYFLTSLWATARDNVVKIAMVCGMVLGPVFYILAPGVDLLLAGIVGGLVAFAIHTVLGRRAGSGGQG